MSRPILSHEPVTAEGASPDAWLYVLHGVYGAGRNWGSVARRLVTERPELGALLVDLRQHGASQGFPPPHTLAAAAADLAALADASGRPPVAVLGHSFGGKVTLAFARDHGAGLREAWIIDSTPAPRDEPGGSAWRMLEILRELPDRFASRSALVEALHERGVDRPVAQWMATNLEATAGDDYAWRFELDAMEALLHDFFRTDLWSVAESPPVGLTLHFVRATRSDVLDDPAAHRIGAAADATGRVRLHRVEGGHWLNADNPAALVELLAAQLLR